MHLKKNARLPKEIKTIGLMKHPFGGAVRSLTENFSGLVVQVWSVTVSMRVERPSSSFSFSSMR